MTPIRKKPILAICGVCLALAGCDLAPHYERPKTDSAGPFKEAVPGAPAATQGWKVAEPNDTLPRGNWWELYHDPQLNDLESRVAVSNQTVAQAEANYRVAHAMLAEARAGLFPSVSVDPSVVRSRGSSAIVNSGNGSQTTSSTAGGTTVTTTGGSNGSTATGPRTDFTLPFEASYEVDLWGSVRNMVAQNSFTAQASAAAVQTALLSSQSTLAQAYFSLRALDEQRRILDTTLEDYESSLHLVRTLYNNGLASDEDLAEADTQLDTAEAQATDLGVQRAQFEHAIAVLIGVPPGQFSIAYGPFSPALPTIPVAMPSDLLERRADIAGAERQVAAANASIGVARAAYFPNLTLNASVGFESTSLPKLLDWPNRMWSLGATAAQFIFDGGLRNAQNAQAVAQYDATVANYRQTVLTAFQSVEDNLATLRILSKEVGQQHSAAVAAQRTVKLSVVRFQNGIDSYVNVITAQNTFLTNRLSELQVELRQVTATILLVNDLGGGWDISQLSETERSALHPGHQKPETPAENAGPGIANPPPLPPASKRPEDLLQQDEQAMAPRTGP
jgi:NodT family efflux transporter outer membrane factor (OMF) lipoprotein